jgi:hypothetical protein
MFVVGIIFAQNGRNRITGKVEKSYQEYTANGEIIGFTRQLDSDSINKNKIIKSYTFPVK